MQSSIETVLVYDIGGSHISAGLCSLDNLSLSTVAKAPISDVTTSVEFLDLLHDLGHRVDSSTASVAGASLAFPGPFDYAAGISHMRHKLESLYGIDLRDALSKRLSLKPETVHFLNDADAYILGEIGAGAARSISRVIGITLGTGIGSGYAVDGHLVKEGKGVPPGGEIWNVPYENGIVEDRLSTHALQLDYQTRTGKQISVREIAESASNDPQATAVFAEFGHRLGKAIRDTMAAFEPQVIVIGGGISHSASLFLPFAQAHVVDLGIRLAISGLMEKAPLVGAGAYWREQSLNPTKQQ